MNPRYPLYIPSKGRWGNNITSRFLNNIKVPHYIVIEEQEYSLYKSLEDKEEYTTLLILDPQYQKDYNTCDDLGFSKSIGPGSARNFAWDHSIKNDFKWHWVMDDNITWFGRLNKNFIVPVSDGTIFKCMEDFVLRYDNVAMAGPNYCKFVKATDAVPPFIINTRIYSCNFIRNDVPFKWRGRYNEDTDLSLNMLKADWCTIQFNAFLQEKTTTCRMKGGNTKEFYKGEGTYPKSKMIEDLHPDVAKVVWRFNRWHHHVNYTPFKHNYLKLKKDVVIPSGVNNYDMKLITLDK